MPEGMTTLHVVELTIVKEVTVITTVARAVPEPVVAAVNVELAQLPVAVRVDVMVVGNVNDGRTRLILSDGSKSAFAENVYVIGVTVSDAGI